MSNGKPLWARDVSSLTGVSLDARYAFVSDDRGAVHALDRSNGRSVWKQDKLANRQLSVPLAAGSAIASATWRLRAFPRRDSGAFVARFATAAARSATRRCAALGLLVQTQNGGCLRSRCEARHRAGRPPNVGKSTLFNRLTRSRDAIVHDVPGR